MTNKDVPYIEKFEKLLKKLLDFVPLDACRGLSGKVRIVIKYNNPKTATKIVSKRVKPKYSDIYPPGSLL